jgi:hypothetical protein
MAGQLAAGNMSVGFGPYCSARLESLWKQNLYKTMLWFIYLAKLRTDLLDNRSLAILLETYKLLICYTLVFGQPLSLTVITCAVVNQMVNYSHDGMASEILGTLRDLWDTGQALSGLLGVACSRRYKPY